MKLGFIGAGNMAGAIMEGVLKKGVLAPEDVHIFDVSEKRMAQMQGRLGVIAHESCADMLGSVDVALLAVKPNVAGSVLREQFDSLCGKALISIAAGWTVSMLRKEVSADTRILRVMPNTPALVGAGMTAFSLEHTLTDDEFAFAKSVFESLGRLVCVHEYQMEAVIGLSGSGPAYAYMFIEALADGGVFCGLNRAQALEMAAQTLLGSAKMALESGMHPGELKDMVCSPGGTTIAAVRSLEEDGFRGSVVDAVIAAADKAAEMRG